MPLRPPRCGKKREVAFPSREGDGVGVEARPYLSAAVGLRVVPTSSAPDRARVAEHATDGTILASLKKCGLASANLYPHVRGHGLDVHINGLGFLSFCESLPFSVEVRSLCGAGCFFRQPIYPREIWRPFVEHLTEEEARKG